jgi:LPXTG-site transpeptidase (sortase) family protein
MTAVRESAAQSATPSPPAAESPGAERPAAGAGAAGGGPASRRPPGGDRRRPPLTPGRLAAGTLGAALLIVAVTALGFVAWVGLFSHLHYDKAQLNAYDALRVELAAGTAPNGPIAPNSPTQQLLPLGAPVAVLSIPAIGLRTVVLQGTTSAVLENGPGHLRTSVMPGQAGVSVILGRQTAYGGPFGGLASLAPGAAIKVVTGQTVAVYRVIDLRRAGDPLPPTLATGAGRLVLVTADGAPLEPSGILYVDADETSKPVGSPGVLLQAYLSPTENAMATDQGAWLPIVLWGQLLVLIAFALSWLWTAWGKWQTWVIAVPAIGFLVLSIADQATRLLPNLM